MTWNTYLYWGESVRERSGQIRSAIADGTDPEHIWILSLAANGTDLIDIHDVRSLSNRAVKSCIGRVIGIAGSKREAMHLAAKILGDLQKQHGDITRGILEEDAASRE